MKGSNQSLAGPVALTFEASGVIQLLNVLTGILLARALGPEGRGELAAAMLWPSMLAAVGGLGVGDALTYFAARRTTPLPIIAGTGLALASAQSTVLILCGAVLIPVALSEHNSATIAASVIFLAFIPVTLTTGHLMGFLNGLHRFLTYNALRILVIAASAVGLVALGLTGNLTVKGAVVVYVGANLLTALTAVVAVIRAAGGTLRPSLPFARKALGFGVRSHLSGVSAMFNERLDQLVVSVVLAPASLGLYVIAVTMTAVTALIGSSIALVALPVLARASSRDSQLRAVRRYVGITLLGCLAVTVPLFIAAPWIIDVAFGDAFAPAGDVTRVLLVASVALALARVLGASLKGLGEPLQAGIGEAIALLITIGALSVFLPTLGIMGAGIASLLAYATSAFWMTRKVATSLACSTTELLLGPKS
jgi:O-antigen/teichoic acid export membrane protein